MFRPNKTALNTGTMLTTIIAFATLLLGTKRTYPDGANR